MRESTIGSKDKGDKDVQEGRNHLAGMSRSDADSGGGGSQFLDPITDDLDAKTEPYALHMAIVLNFMDVLEDAKSVLKALNDAKRAYADHASDKAMMAMNTGERANDKEN